jgi:hypothetical protein
MTAPKRIMSVFALLGLLALFPAAPRVWAAETDPTILAAVDSAIAAINAGSVTDAKAVFTDAPAAIIDDFPPFLWSGKNAVEDYSRDGRLDEVRHHGLALPTPSTPLHFGDGGSRLACRADLVSVSSWREASERLSRLGLRIGQG